MFKLVLKVLYNEKKGGPNLALIDRYFITEYDLRPFEIKNDHIICTYDHYE